MIIMMLEIELIKRLHHTQPTFVMIQLIIFHPLSNTFSCLPKQTAECLKDAACWIHVTVGRPNAL